MRSCIRSISILLILILLTGCNTNINEENLKPIISENTFIEGKELGEAVPFEIVSYRYGVNRYGEMEIENVDKIQSWEAEIYEKYNVKINLKDAGNFWQKFDGYMQAYYVENSSANGFVFIPNIAKNYIDVFVENNNILPLNDYVEDNETWNNLPLMMQNMYKDEAGNIWAIPYGFEPTFGARYINKEWLEDSQLPLPETLDELLELAMQFSNRSNTEYFTSLSFYNPTRGLIDIFNANGCYITNGEINGVSSSVSFDPETNTYEDSMLKPEMRNTLHYIMNMVQNKYIYVKKANDKEITVGSKYNNDIEMFSSSKYEFIYSLKGSRSINTMPVYINKLTGFYVLTNNSENPKYVVNQFLDIFYGNEEGHFMGKYGIPGGYYEIENHVVTLNMLEFQMKREFLQPVVGEFETYASGNVQYEYINMPYDESMKYSEYKKDVYSFVDDRVDSKEAYLLLPKFTDLRFLLDILVGEPNELNTFDNSMTSMLNNNRNIDEVITEYISIMKRLNGQEKINEMNEKLGVTPIYKY